MKQESSFSKQHAAATPPNSCWICHLPFKRSGHHNDPLQPSSDHIIPCCHGGFKKGTRLAHRCCNSERHEEDVTPSMVSSFRIKVFHLLSGNLNYSLIPKKKDWRWCSVSGIRMPVHLWVKQKKLLRAK